MPNIKGNEGILLQPGTKTTRIIEVPVKTNINEKKGFLAPGTTISNINLIATKNETGINVTTDLIQTYSFDDDSITITFKYPNINGDGRYKLKITLAISSGDVEIITMDRIVAVTL